MPFKPGQSGNRAGRPPGCGKIQKFRSAIEKDAPAIIAALTESAIGGDPVSAKLLLDRVLPALKPETRSAAAAGQIPVDPDGILAAAATGAIGIDQATALMALATARQRLAEGEALIAKVESLEIAIREMQVKQ